MGKISGVIQFTGKVGQVVGYGTGDRKKIRARADVVTNPRTKLQCVQRMICATASGLISAFPDIYSNSVEGVAKGADSLAYWRGELMRDLRTSNILSEPNGFIYAKRGAQFPVPNQLPIARGKLRGVNIASLNGNDHLILGTGFAPDAEATASEALAAFDYTLGDQITVAVLGGSDDEVYPRVLRFAFNNDTVPAFVRATSNPGFVLNEAALDLTKCAGAFDKVVFTAAGDGTINVLEATDLEFLFAAAIIVSRKEGQKRSSATFVVAQDVELPGFSAVSAAPSYAGAGTPVEAVSDVYLDNSTRSVTVPEPVPGPTPPGPEPSLAHITGVTLAGRNVPQSSAEAVTINLSPDDVQNAPVRATMEDSSIGVSYGLSIKQRGGDVVKYYDFDSLGIVSGVWDLPTAGTYDITLMSEGVILQNWCTLVITFG